MSKIDQAFIHAYAPDSPPVVPFAHPTQQAPEPRIDSPSVAASERTPHFSTAPTAEAHAQIAAMQQSVARQQATDYQPAPRVHPPASERRPLSSFSAPEPTVDKSFRPMFEVDAFRWPQVTTDLLMQHAPLLVPVAEQLLVASEAGQSLIGIAGTRPQVGSTTVLLCLARLLASAKKCIALVDADFMSHSLASDLGLEVESGWEDVLIGQVPLAEGVIRSLKDNVSLLPLAGHTTPALELVSSIQTSVSAGVLRYHYDVVLFDLGPAAHQPQWSVAQKILQYSRIDTSLIVADAQHSDPTANEDVDQLLALMGNDCLGLIGNDAVC